MALTERLALLVTLDAQGAVQGLNSVGRAADKNLSTTETKLSRTADKMSKVGLVAGGIMAAGIAKGIDAAGDLEQAVGGTEAVFKDLSGEIDRFAKGAAKNMGLSEREFREATTSLGGQLKGVGFRLDEAADKSIELTEVAADLAATYGGTTADAVAALGSAFRGEADPAEHFNLRLNQNTVNAKAVALGLAESTGAVDAHAKAQATLALIMEQSADAQGQFTRESGTAAGAAKIAAAEAENAAASLGDSLTPIYAKATEVAGGLAHAFGALPEPVQTGVIALGGLVTVSGPVLRGIESIRTATTGLGSGIGATAGGVGSLTTRLGGLARAAGIAGAAVGTIWLAAQFRGGIDDQLDDLRDNLGATEEAAESLEAAIRQDGGGFGEFTRSAVEARIASLDMADELEHAGITFADLAAAAERYRAAGGDVNAQLDATRFLSDKLGFELDGTSTAMEYLVAQMAEGAGESKNLGKVMGVTAGESDGLTGAFDKQKEALEGLLDATLAQFDSNLGYRNSINEAHDALVELDAVQAEHGTRSEEYRDQLRDVEGAFLDQATAAVRFGEDQAKAAGKSLDAADKTRIYKDTLSALTETLAPGSSLRQLLEGYIAQLNSIPTKISTFIELKGAAFTEDLKADIKSGKRSFGASSRWGNVIEYASGGITPAHIAGPGTILKYAEPETGGEAFIPRRGDPRRSLGILNTAAGWYGANLAAAAPNASAVAGGVSREDLQVFSDQITAAIATIDGAITIHTTGYPQEEPIQAAIRELKWHRYLKTELSVR